MKPGAIQSGQLMYQENHRLEKALEHVYLAGSLVAIAERPYSSWVANNLYQHTDALGSPVAVTDQSGTVVDRTVYEPYGKPVGKTIDGAGYTGHVMDPQSGLVYMQQRYYDPVVGRFLSVDPVTTNPNTGASLNRYNYAANNPYRFTDPDGRAACALGREHICRFAVERAKKAKSNPGGEGEAEFVASVAERFRGSDSEQCAKVCKGEDGYVLSEIRTDKSHIACDAGRASCPSGTEEVADVHSHLPKGKYSKNAADIRFLGRGRVGQPLKITKEQAEYFSEDDRALNVRDGIDGWLVPAERGVILHYDHETSKVTPYDESK